MKPPTRIVPRTESHAGHRFNCQVLGAEPLTPIAPRFPENGQSFRVVWRETRRAATPP